MSESFVHRYIHLIVSMGVVATLAFLALVVAFVGGREALKAQARPVVQQDNIPMMGDEELYDVDVPPLPLSDDSSGFEAEELPDEVLDDVLYEPDTP